MSDTYRQDVFDTLTKDQQNEILHYLSAIAVDGSPALIWEWEDTSKCLRCLSPHCGDEEWLAIQPDGEWTLVSMTLSGCNKSSETTSCTSGHTLKL